MRWGLVVGGLVVHLIFFHSIFDIYFTSPLTHGMSPHQNPLPPPADRLVLFVADGLRADKLFELDNDGKTRAPFLRNVMENEGVWGISHTRVPTESRPGHVALIAGFYEDVSAVAKGWKENPVEFDSVFNQSKYTWSWGSPDILPMFAKGASGDHVLTKMYPGESEDFAGSNLHKLDTWVFENVKDFLNEASSNTDLKQKVQQRKIVLFLHLLGLDTNGHAHKPYSHEYLENIRTVDKGIADLVTEIERFYGNDNKTAYVFSADHGMTNWGSHGAGHPSETLTPFVAWGPGIRKPKDSSGQKSYDDNFQSEWGLDKVWREDVNQADICPLMASLIGTNYPMNSVGTLPVDVLSGGPKFKAESLYTNALQILEQFQIKMEQKQDTTLSILFTPFKPLLPSTQADLVRNIRNLIQAGLYDDALSESQTLIKLALEGLSYYHNYDRFFLGLSIALGFVGWMVYVVTLILRNHTRICQPHSRLEELDLGFWKTEKGIRIIFTVIGVSIFMLLYVQSLPLTHYVYCLLPVILWVHAAKSWKSLRDLQWYITDHGLIQQTCIMVLIGGTGLEIIVLGFFHRDVFSVGLVAMAVWPLFTNLKAHSPGIVAGWLTSCLFVSAFPLLPVVGRDSNYSLVLLAGFLAVLFGCFALIRSDNKKSSFPISLQSPHNVKLLTVLQISILLASIYNVYRSAASILRKEGLPSTNQVISWAILASSFIQPMFSSSDMYRRLTNIALAFIAPYILLSTSHEGLFLLALCVLMFFWIQLEACVFSQGKNKNMQLEFEEGFGLGEAHRKLVLQDLRCAYFFIYFLLIGFFGTGNIASINTFDPSSVLCFLTVFNPFVMGGLMLWKILIPLLLVTCAFNAIHLSINVPTQSLFFTVILMSDFMALHFFFMVRDYGSWLEIGTSISHYVIVMSMISFLILLIMLSKVFTNIQLVSSRKSHRQ